MNAACVVARLCSSKGASGNVEARFYQLDASCITQLTAST